MRKRSTREIRRLIERERVSSGPRTRLVQRAGEATRRIPVEAHHLRQYLNLTSWLGADPVSLAPALFIANSEVTDFMARRQLPLHSRRALCGLNAGAEYGPAKRWPPERFIAAARDIQRRTGCHWIVLGGPGDLELARQVSEGIASGSPKDSEAAFNLAGSTSLRELCAVLKACEVLLTNDTGPMHVAAALGTPVVVPFGSTSPALTGPGLPGNSEHQVLEAGVPCAPCFRRECPIDFRCMREISESRAVAAVLAVLAEKLAHPVPRPSNGSG
jgi:heptosyltransferase-2